MPVEKIIMREAKRQVIHEEEEQVEDRRVEKLF
jgi:hypothetical protein